MAGDFGMGGGFAQMSGLLGMKSCHGPSITRLDAQTTREEKHRAAALRMTEHLVRFTLSV